MVELGKLNILKIERRVDFGVYLDGKNLGEILMPKRYVTPKMQIGDDVEVVVYLDGEERLVATTEKPFATVGQFAWLRVNKVEDSGAFLDWGLLKELLVPFSEQKIKMEEGRFYLVYIYIDKVTDRIVATMKLEKFFSKELPEYDVNEEVDLIIWTPTEIGYKAIVNGKDQGILYRNEVYRKLHTGDKLKGYIKKIRDDGKIDLILDQPGIARIDSASQNILNIINKAGGFLPYNDKTEPEIIYNIFGVSKKAFKQGIGNLFKQRLIRISEKGIEKS
ncbi:MAG: GntR family transcriptional regulator [Saprospiraceae bacterium]|jgi:predicted RNA-binding protein (virulence factor B family)|nr:GntR family transcriptional regulator [Saprospiraceae bacterium]MBL0027160.1 GntR family transcriptional regulator [Saprospiraceae bacterium]